VDVVVRGSPANFLCYKGGVPPKIVIWGASGHARVVADIIRTSGSYEIAAFLDDVQPGRAGERFEGAPVAGGREQLAACRAAGATHLIVAFGNCAARLEAAREAIASGFTLGTAIHPSAVVAASARIGAGSVVAANAVVNPAAVIGENVIINTSASVDHDCVVENGAHLCPGVRLAGGVRIGAAAWIGIGATVADQRTIGSGALVGAGAVVVSDIPEHVVAYGVPARVIRRTS
jgi:UDP-N-acetylbacillosamine N-acetyltransferase